MIITKLKQIMAILSSKFSEGLPIESPTPAEILKNDALSGNEVEIKLPKQEPVTNNAVVKDEWLVDGVYHRFSYDGEKIYVNDGELANGIVATNPGEKRYCKDGVEHREDGPAVIISYGQLEWWQNGVLHREDGLAIINPRGEKTYFIHGNLISEEDFVASKLEEVIPDKNKKNKLKI